MNEKKGTSKGEKKKISHDNNIKIQISSFFFASS